MTSQEVLSCGNSTYVPAGSRGYENARIGESGPLLHGVLDRVELLNLIRKHYSVEQRPGLSQLLAFSYPRDGWVRT